MRQRATLVASASLGLLLTGCPLTDDYELRQEDPAGVMGGSGGLAGSESGSAGVVDAGGPSSSGGPALAPGAPGSGGDGETSGQRRRRGEWQHQHLRRRIQH